MQFPEESTKQVLSGSCETEAEQSHPFLIQLHGDYMGSQLNSNEGFYFLWWMSIFSIWSSSCHTAQTFAKKVIQRGRINFNSTSFLFWDLVPKINKKAPSPQDPATPRPWASCGCCHHCRVPWDFWAQGRTAVMSPPSPFHTSPQPDTFPWPLTIRPSDPG